MSARVRTVAAAICDWIVSPVTMTAAVLVAVIMGVWLVLDPPRGDVAGPPAEVAVAKVGGFCATIVTGFDGSVWALVPGAVDGQLKRVDAADVDRTSEVCTR
ncbi:hypothetical protein [Mycolicibacterium smegmatis]|uniref:hypothetical protein n=1 Tax=Mycolicibacterium smegmatis TaxID=1772 RepID=UPI0013034295|nr:hypothetical protein [Mycolicibacterium smegmatis]